MFQLLILHCGAALISRPVPLLLPTSSNFFEDHEFIIVSLKVKLRFLAPSAGIAEVAKR